MYPVFLTVLGLILGIGGQTPQEEETALSQILQRPAAQPHTGDLGEIRKRRVIRVLVSYNSTNLFITTDGPRGYEYELLKEYERHLNKGVSRKEVQTTMAFVPVTRARLLPALIEGRGDVAAAGLTITEGRLSTVSFTDPYLKDVSEIVVTSKAVQDVGVLDDLSGRKVLVTRKSSYAEHLKAINEDLTRRGRSPIQIVEAADHLETGDLLELVHAGVVELTVADRHIAQLWSSLLSGIVPRTDLEVSSGGLIAWAVRKTTRSCWPA